MNEDPIKKDVKITTKDKGNALEKDIEFIFQSAGFETRRNIRLAKYEIDVLVKIGDRNLIVECKNYQTSNLVIRNLIHEWNSKNKVIRASKVIIVITGLNIKDSDRKLADELDIELWDESDITDLFNLTLKPIQLRERLLSKISFKPITISEKYRDNIASIVITPILKGINEDIEETYRLFNNWLRSFIRTDLQINGTTKEDRIKHIELFEGTKEKGAFFNLFKVKRGEKEYWDKLKDRLSEEKILNKKVQDKYLKIMSELIEEYTSQKEYYNEKDQENKIRKLILDRIYDSVVTDYAFCNFGFDSKNTVQVMSLEEGKFEVSIEGINEKQANLINWILTSEYSFIPGGKDTLDSYSWFCSSLEETSEKVYRILEEFYGYDEDDELKDYSLI